MKGMGSRRKPPHKTAAAGTFVIKNKGANRLYFTIRQNVNAFVQKNQNAIEDCDVLSAVQLPRDEDRREWVAANTVDFFNELTLLYGLCYEDAAKRNYKPGEGFPVNHQYQWTNRDGPVFNLTGADYCDYVLTWVEELLDDRNVFPVEDDEPWPEDFLTNHMRTVYRRLFRVFNIIYHEHFHVVKTIGNAEFHLNTCFKHFIFFSKEFSLLDFRSEEMDSLRHAISNILRHYEKECDRQERRKRKVAKSPLPVY